MKTAHPNVSVLTAVVLLCVFPAVAQKVGSTSMQYLSVLPGTRAASMGNAYAAVAHGVDGVFWNPAGVALTDGQEFSSTYIRWLFDTRQYALAYAVSLGDVGSLGVQLQYNDYGSFEEAVLPAGDASDYYPGQEFPYLTGRLFKPYSYVAGLTFATRLTERFSTGMSVKYSHESLFDQPDVYVDSANGNVKTYGDVVLFDVGVHYNTGFHTIQVGASVHNFGPAVQYAVDKYSVPMLFRVGIAGDLLGINSLLFESQSNRLGLAFDIYQSSDYNQQQHVGLEYEYAETIAFRAGYKLNYDIEGLTYGVGIRQQLGSLKFSFDYGYGATDAHVSSFGKVHRVSVGVGIQ